MRTSLFFTSECAEHFKLLTRNAEGVDLKIRIFLKGGGCAGVQYRFALDQKQEPGDIRINVEGTIVLLDGISYYYLKGSVVDFRLVSNRGSFIIYNPNAIISCSCGASFSVTPDERP